MAWIEQTGERSWRVRYHRPSGGYGSESGFRSPKAARDYADDLESDRRHGRWLDPDGGKTLLAAWADRWINTVDVEARTEENYRGYLRNHILPRWASTPLGAISALEVTAWIKTLRTRYAASTVSCIVTVFSMMLDDAVDDTSSLPTPSTADDDAAGDAITPRPATNGSGPCPTTSWPSPTKPAHSAAPPPPC